MKCRICGYEGEPEKIITEIDRKIVSIFRCPKCAAEDRAEPTKNIPKNIPVLPKVETKPRNKNPKAGLPRLL